MTRITYDPAKLELAAKGHAGGGVYGEDLICSAVSALFLTLAAAMVKQFVRPETIRLMPGDSLIRAVPEDAGKGRVVFDTVAAGLEYLAGEYPEHVSFSVGGGG